MARIEQEEIDALRNQADIVNVISHYIPVQRSGKGYKAICPFHNDHDPSMSISPERQIYKCFVCGNGGNVFTFVQNFEKVSFVEAVEKVAELTGFHLSSKPAVSKVEVDPHKKALYNVLNETINYTMYQLDTSVALHAKEYLEKRGIDAETRKEFQIGYDPDRTSVTKFLRAKGFEEKDLVSSNVSRVNENGLFDVYAERITFPIHDMNGNPIGFSARTMDPDNPSKYINTNQTDIFTKGDIVYNLHRAKNEARRNKCIYLCEGVTDVIAFYKAGIKNAVCTLGTACTQHQLSLLKRCSTKLIFCYDGDHAGQSATYKACKLALSLGAQVGIVLNKTGKDPDEIIRMYGNEGLVNLVKTPITWVEFLYNYLVENTNLNSYSEKKELIQKAKEDIQTLTDSTDRSYFIDKIQEVTKLHSDFDVNVPVTKNVTPSIRLVVPDGTKDAEEMILSMMLKSYQATQIFENDLGYLIEDTYSKLALTILDISRERGKCDIQVLIDASSDQAGRDLITKLVTRDDYDQAFDEEKMKGAVRKIKMAVLSMQSAQLKQQINHALNGESLSLLINKYNECLKEQRRLLNEENQNSSNE